MDPVTNAKTLVGSGTGARIERILCPVDFSEVSLTAYRYAESIAGRCRATLIVQHIIELFQHVSACYCPSEPVFEEFREKLIADGRSELQRFVNAPGSIQPECIVQGSIAAADGILSLARARAISLIVLGTHGRRGFDHLMLGSVTERVLRHASCPVLTVRQAASRSGKQGAADEPVSIRRILCCIDFSAHSRRALEYSLSVAAAYDAEVTLLHVLDGIPDSADVGKETAAAIASMEELFPPDAPRSPKTHLQVRLGKAYKEILQSASEARSDLIVTGVRGRQSLDLAVFGSTTYRVIQLGPGPVLTVPI
jgi:nucleotide-binding universal stress UspA family protein